MGGRFSRERVGGRTDGAAEKEMTCTQISPPPSESSSTTSDREPSTTRASPVAAKKSSTRLGRGDTVVIAGGGISGLALAVALQAAPESTRPNVIVLERDETSAARRQGYGVTLSETNAALAGLGILDDLRENNTKSNAHWTFRDDGKVLGYYGGAFLPQNGNGNENEKDKKNPTNLRVPRNKVREILLNRLLPGTVLFGTRVVGYEEVVSPTAKEGAVDFVKVAVETIDAMDSEKEKSDAVGAGAGRAEWRENETVLKPNQKTSYITCSLLVAADGVRSQVQRQRLPDSRLNYLGVVLVTGFTKLNHPLLAKQGFYTLDGERARIFTMPFSAPKGEESSETDMGSTHTATPPRSMWQISVRVTEAEARVLSKAPRRNRDGDGDNNNSKHKNDTDTSTDRLDLSSVEGFVRSVAGTWHAPVPRMFTETDWESVWCGPLYDRDEPRPPPTGGAAKSRVVAIGDAAHPMSPFKGMGANTALFDAWHFARWLSKASSVPKAIANFNREMITRAWVKVKASREACVSFHSKAAVAGAPEFAGVDPGVATAFLDGLHLKQIHAGTFDLEGATRNELRVFRARGLGTSGVDGSWTDRVTGMLTRSESSDSQAPEIDPVKPYAYLKRKGKEETFGGDQPQRHRSCEVEGFPKQKRERLEQSRRRRSVPPSDVADSVGHAFVDAMFALKLDPLTEDERFIAKTLVPASGSKNSRPAHDWVSRAALKIAHKRFGEAAESITDASSICESIGDETNSESVSRTDESSVFDNEDDACGPFALAMRIARATADVLDAEAAASNSRELVTHQNHDESANTNANHTPVVAAAKPSIDGQLFVTSQTRFAAMAKRGLATCVGCGKFFAVHSGGLRQHWARGGGGEACAAAASAAQNASMTDAEAATATGGVVGAAAESSAWRGAGNGRPKPWRETLTEVYAYETDGSRFAASASVGVPELRGKGSTDDVRDDVDVDAKGSTPPTQVSEDERKVKNEVERLRRRSPGLAAAAVGDVSGMQAACADSKNPWNPVADVDQHGSGALHWAAGGGHVEACAWLVCEKHVPINQTRRKDNRAPLHWASRNGRLLTCKWLVEHGAEINAVTYDGDTPFALAVWRGHDDVAKWFVSQGGIDPGTRNKWGCNVLLWACMRPESPLATVKWLVEELKVPTTIINVNGHGAIHKCAIYGHCDVIDWLVANEKCGFSAEHLGKDDRGSGPADLATTNGFYELASRLRKLEDTTCLTPVVYVGGVDTQQTQ